MKLASEDKVVPCLRWFFESNIVGSYKGRNYTLSDGMTFICYPYSSRCSSRNLELDYPSIDCSANIKEYRKVFIAKLKEEVSKKPTFKDHIDCFVDKTEKSFLFVTHLTAIAIFREEKPYADSMRFRKYANHLRKYTEELFSACTKGPSPSFSLWPALILAEE